MKLLIRDGAIVSALKRKMEFENENSEVIYTAKGNTTLSDREIRLYDIDSNEIACIEEMHFTSRRKCTIDIYGSDVIRIKRKFGIGVNYNIEGNDWVIDKDPLTSDFDLSNKDNKVASFRKLWANMDYKFELDIERSEDVILSVCIVLVINTLYK